jgi:N-acyl-phosphatidylethanolamine-hydrolysing phospholipase D
MSTVNVKQRIAARVAERNTWSTYVPSTFRKGMKLISGKDSFFSEVILQKKMPSEKELDQTFPVMQMDFDALREPDEASIQSTWIGHSTLLVQMSAWNIITDPIFSSRCAPTQFMGPRRYRRPACTIRELFEKGIHIDVVLISHNHYDHLDYASVKELAALALETGHNIHFVVPLGVKAWFTSHVPDSFKKGNAVTEIDWHESHIINDGARRSLEVTGLPMQHWSSRHGFDRDKSLWCGFGVKVMKNDENECMNFLFAGDTGYFHELESIGSTYGPFHLAAIPIGAYEPRWFMKDEHADPDDAVKIMAAVRTQYAFPIHWGTFKLTPEPVLEPRDRLYSALEKANKDRNTFLASFIGETMTYPCV